MPVLYRPADLSANTDGKGSVATVDLEALQRLNAAYNFAIAGKDGARTYPYRDSPQRTPTLSEALRAIPPSITVMLDMKALPAAIARVLDEQNAWPHVLLYSTDAAYTNGFRRISQNTRLRITRCHTRTRLANVALAQECTAPPPAEKWAASSTHEKWNWPKRSRWAKHARR